MIRYSMSNICTPRFMVFPVGELRFIWGQWSYEIPVKNIDVLCPRHGYYIIGHWDSVGMPVSYNRSCCSEENNLDGSTTDRGGGN